MRTWTVTFLLAACIAGPLPLTAQESSPMPTIPKATSVDKPTSSTSCGQPHGGAHDKKKIGSNDYVSFRVVEDRDDEAKVFVNDTASWRSLIGLVPAAAAVARTWHIPQSRPQREYSLTTRCHRRRSRQRKIARQNFRYGSVKGRARQEMPPAT